MTTHKQTLRQKFADFEDTPDRDVWGGIEQEIRQKPKKRVLAPWIKGLSIAASVALLVGLGWYMGTESQTNTGNDLAIENKTPSLKPETSFTPSDTEKNAKNSTDPEAISVAEKTDTQTGKKTITRTYMVQVTETYEKVPSLSPVPQAETPKLIKQEVVTQEYIPVKVPQDAVVVKENATANKPENTAKPAYVLYEIVKPSSPVKVENTASKGSKQEFKLDDLHPSSLLGAAAEQVNKMLKSPVDILKEDKGDKESKTWQFRLKDFQISHKSTRDKQS